MFAPLYLDIRKLDEHRGILDVEVSALRISHPCDITRQEHLSILIEEEFALSSVTLFGDLGVVHLWSIPRKWKEIADSLAIGGRTRDATCCIKANISERQIIAHTLEDARIAQALLHLNPSLDLSADGADRDRLGYGNAIGVDADRLADECSRAFQRMRREYWCGWIKVRLNRPELFNGKRWQHMRSYWRRQPFDPRTLRDRNADAVIERESV